jgi:EF-hand domain-containing protein 1
MEESGDECGNEMLTYKLFYYLEDDNVAIKELKENQQGRDHFPMLLKRTKLPKNWKRKPVTYPSIALELTDAEVDEYYQPKDFKIGETIFVFGRKFLLLNCDTFTRAYFENVLKDVQGNRLEIRKPERKTPKRVG